MKRFNLLMLSCFLASCITTYSQDQQSKNIFGAGIGAIFPQGTGIYLDIPFDTWPDREASVLFQLFYARQVSETFRIGPCFEYESARFDIGQPESGVFHRYNIGANWLGQYPKTKLHVQLGGYFAFGMVTANDWDNLKGIDMGLMAGPAYESNNFGVALHVQSGFGAYFSSGAPESVLLLNPKLLLKFYYKL